MSALARPLARIRRWPAPWRLLFGPVFQRDMRALGRRRGTYAIRFLFAGGLAALAVLVTIGVMDDIGSRGALARQQSLQSLAPALTLTVGWFTLVALSFASVVSSAGAICDERHKRTLPALMTTPLSAAEIVFSTLMSRFTQLAILALSSLPILLAARALGGARASTVLAFFAVALSTTLLGIAIALLASVGARRSNHASAYAFTILNAIFFGPLILLALAGITGASTTATTALGWASLASSPMVAMALSAELVGGGGFPISAYPLWLYNTALNILLAVAFAALASATLRRRMRLDATTGGPALRQSRRSRRRKGAAPTDRARARTISDHPLLWRELRQPVAHSRGFVITLSVAILAGLALLTFRLGPSEDITYLLPAVLSLFAILFLAASSATPSIAGERESRTWETLLTTRASPAAILTAKLAGALRRQWAIPALIITHQLLVGVTGRNILPVAPLHYLLAILGPMLLLTTTGVVCSLLAKSPARAATLNIGLALLLFAGLPLLVAMLANLSLIPHQTIDAITEPFLLAHPLPATIIPLSENVDSARYVSAPRTRYDFDDLRLSTQSLTLVMTLIVLAYATLSALILAAATALFPRLAPRAN